VSFVLIRICTVGEVASRHISLDSDEPMTYTSDHRDSEEEVLSGSVKQLYSFQKIS